MDSSPRPMRRFSRWKTTKHTFVLGGKTFVTGNKSHKASNVKNGNSSRRSDKRLKIRHSPRSPHKEKSHSSADAQIKESSFINVDFNCKVMICNMHDPEKTGLVPSNNEQAQNDCIVATSPQALTVLSPNVTTTTKDSPAVIPPSKGHDVDTENDSKSHHNPIRQTDQLDPGPKQDSNPNSVHIDKENSTSVVAPQPDISSCPGSPVQTLVPSDSHQSKNADESTNESSLRRQSLRDRSLLQSSAVLRQKNYPFFSVSKTKRSTEKKVNKSVNRPNKLLTSPSSSVVNDKRKGRESVEKVAVVSGDNLRKSIKKSEKEKTNGNVCNESQVNEKRKGRESVEKVAIVSGGNHRKSNKKREKEKTNGSVYIESQLDFQEEQSRSLGSSRFQSATKSSSERKRDGSNDCDAQIVFTSDSVSKSNKRKTKYREIHAVVNRKELKSGTKQKKQKGEEADLDVPLSVSSTQNAFTSEIRKGPGAHSKQETSLPLSDSKSIQRKAERAERQQLLVATKHALNKNSKTQLEKANCERSMTKGRKNIETSHETLMHSSGADSNVSVAATSSSRRSLRDRSALGTPQMQYPARYMSAAMLKSLSDKAKKLLSIPQTKSVSKLSPEKVRSVSKGNAGASVTLIDKIPRKKSTSKSKASLEHSTQDNITSVASLSLKKKFQSKVSHNIQKIGSNSPKPLSSLPKLSRQHNAKEASENLSQGVSPVELLQVPIAPGSSVLELQTKQTCGSNTSRLPSSSPRLKVKGNRRRNPVAEKRDNDWKDKEMNSHIENRKRKSADISRKLMLKTKDRKQTLSLCKPAKKSSSDHTSADRIDGPSGDIEQETEVSVPTSSRNGDVVLNETAVGSKQGFKRRRLFQDSFSQAKKMKLRRDLYDSVGREILLWSETGEARKASSVTSIDILFNDVIGLEDHLKDSETEYLQQRVVGKVMGRMKRSLKSQICQLERVRELESEIKMSRDRCNKLKEDIREYDDKQKGLERKLKRRKETEQKTLQEWMKSLKSLMTSSRKT